MKNISKAFSLLLFLLIVTVLFFPDTCIDGIQYATFAPLLWKAGSDNMGGYKNRIAFIPESSVSAAPTLPKLPVKNEDYVTAAGTFTFITEGGKPLPIYATRSTVGYKSEQQGEEDCKSFKITGEFFHPGSKIEAAVFARQVCNTPGYLLIEDEEKQILVGQPGYPCSVSTSFDGGKAPADKRGYAYTFAADSVTPMIVMETPIDLDALFVTEPSKPANNE